MLGLWETLNSHFLCTFSIPFMTPKPDHILPHPRARWGAFPVLNLFSYRSFDLLYHHFYKPFLLPIHLSEMSWSYQNEHNIQKVGGGTHNSFIFSFIIPFLCLVSSVSWRTHDNDLSLKLFLKFRCISWPAFCPYAYWLLWAAVSPLQEPHICFIFLHKSLYTWSDFHCLASEIRFIVRLFLLSFNKCCHFSQLLYF